MLPSQFSSTALALALVLGLAPGAARASDSIVIAPASAELYGGLSVPHAAQNLGTAVAVDGEWAVATDALHDHDGISNGAAFVYQSELGVWSQHTVLFPPLATGSGGFGTRAAISGDTLVVASSLATGYLAFYRLSGSVWSLEQTILAEDLDGPSFVAPNIVDIALDGDRLIASVLRSTGSGNGAAVFLERAGSTWSQVGFGPLVNNPAGTAISGDFAFGIISGGTEVYERVGGTWQQVASLPHGIATGRVSVEGTRAVVSNPQVSAPEGEGAAYAYERVDGTWTLVQTIADRNVTGGDALGTWTDLAGDRLAIGVWRGFHSIQFYEHDGSAWAFQGELFAPSEPLSWGERFELADAGTLIVSEVPGASIYADPTSGGFQLQQLEASAIDFANPHFGRSVALQDGLLVVGAPFASASDPGEAPGVALVFARTGSSWSLEATLSAPDGHDGDQFGFEVALDGERALVGAPAHLAPGFKGAAYVFERDGGTWTLHSKLSHFGAEGRKFGRSVEIDGARIAVGAVGPAAPGAVFTFELVADQWIPRTRLAAPSPLIGDQFGFSLALDGALLAVGHHAVSVEMFEEQPAGWVHAQTLLPNSSQTVPTFGRTVDLDGSVLAMGAPLAQPASNSGYLAIYEREAGTWNLAAELFNTTGLERLGQSVAVRGDLVASGFQAGFSGGGGVFGIYLAQKEHGQWSLGAPFMGPELGEFGYDVSLAAEGLAAGSIAAFDPTVSAFAGAAYVFAIDHQPAGFCAGDGSAHACPCGNGAGAGEGCAHSGGFGARLESSGSTSVAAANLSLDAVQLPQNKPGIFFAGVQPIAATLGDGLLCVAPQYRSQAMFSGLGGAFSLTDVAAKLMAGAGDVFYAQVWFRDPLGPCGTLVSTSAGLVVTFTP